MKKIAKKNITVALTSATRKKSATFQQTVLFQYDAARYATRICFSKRQKLFFFSFLSR